MSKDLNDLLYLFCRQFPSGITTFAPCPICKEPARGGGWCKDCLREKLIAKGVKKRRLNSLEKALIRRSDAIDRVETELEIIRNEGTC